MAVTIRQEINLIDSASIGPISGIVQLDTTKYDNPTYYFEIVAAPSSSGNVSLRRNGTSTDDATFTSPSSLTRYRTSFTPPAGQTEYYINSTVVPPHSARIIIIDNPSSLTKSQTQIEIGSLTSITTTTASGLPKYWLYTAANWDGTTTFYAEVSYFVSSSKVNTTITLQEDDGSFGSWADKVTIVSAGTATSTTRVRSASFTPTNGRHYRIAGLVSSSKSSATISLGKVVVDQTNNPTKLEPQYLVLNRSDFGLKQGYQQLWSASEWSGVTNSYYYAHDASNSADTSYLVDIDNSDSQISGTSVTGANQQISGSFTMPTDGHQFDMYVTVSTGVISSGRVLAVVSVDAAASTVKQLAALGVG